ncbi:site-specific integrase [Mycolicibacter sp. MYC123]|uniref:Site-specific integrase n=1 Tax=[Mycobacterium] zoologicum TaxID=2872311 RepID=A0ABU5YG12_9MYCO|nr:site-specific integrase [Mycolicibacter sp. MYC123]MEB3048991.1 site-specific integrase [Mycolicibacter sp. MYC123]
MARKRTTGQRRTWGRLQTQRSGRIQASYVYDDGRRYYAPHTFSAKMDAEGWLADERKLIERGDWTPPASRAAVKSRVGLTLRQYAEQWLAQRDLTPKTRAMYGELLGGRIYPSLGDERLTSVTAATVRTWWLDMDKSTPTRNRHAYQLLRAVFNTARGDGLVTDNPCQIATAVKASRPREVRVLTPAELVKVAESVPEKYRVAVPLAAWCGLRFGELIELRRKDIQTHDKRAVIRIRRAATVVDGKIVVGQPKTDAGIRDVTVPPHVADLLRAHMKRHTKSGPESFVFTTTRGLRLSKTAFTKSLKAGYAKVGKPGMRVHDLRHTGATLAAQAGATTKELMLRIGHTTPAMALRYQHVAEGRDAAIADKLSALAGFAQV